MRTYATLDGVPGVWFLSLDATQPLGVWAARTLFHLPYLHARMRLTQQGNTLRMVAERTHAHLGAFRAVRVRRCRLPRSHQAALAATAASSSRQSYDGRL